MPAPPFEALQLEPSAHDAPRRRYLTILFADLSGSTRIAESLEAEDYLELLARLRAIYHAVVSRHEGTIAQISGDGMLALFGYPHSREGDGRRAVDAAIELHSAVAGLGFGSAPGGNALRLHSGIHSGLVLLQEGDQCRGRFELLGCATNIASRLCAAAEAGEILVSKATLGPERSLFEARERRRVRLRGADEAIDILAVTGRAGCGGAEPAPFVGREAELAALAAHRAAGGERRFVLIEGPPGVGKTRLAEEFLRRHGGAASVHRATCEAAAEPLQPFRQIAQAILGLAPAAATDEATASLSGGTGSRAGAAAAIADLIGRGAALAPLLLFIDDWHLCDDASREVAALLQASPAPGLFLLATARPEPALRVAGFQRATLGPFGDSETRRAVSRLLPTPDPFTVEEIRSASGGNPLFIEELCHALAAGGRERRREGGTPWLATLIESRVARLEPAQAALVRTAAVVGTTIPCWLIESLTGRSADHPDIANLATLDFLYPGERTGTLRFKHGITREVIYQSVGLHERRALHLRIAAALRARAAASGEEEPVEALAYHYGGADAAEPTADYAELAGDKALAASALDRAQSHYRAALDALDRLPPSSENAYRWSRIAQRFGRAGVYDPSREQLAIFERSIEKALQRADRAAFAWAEYWLGYINYGLGEPIAAIRHWSRALDAATTIEDERLEAQVRAALGQGMAAACDYDKALPLLDTAIAARRTSRRGTVPIGTAYALSCKGFALGDMGRFEDAQACFDEAMSAIRGARHEVEVSVLNQNSVVCMWQGRFEEALPLALEGLAVAERIRSRYSHAMSRSIAAFARWSIDRSAGAGDELVEATALLVQSGRGQFTSLNHGWLAELMVAEGRWADARRFAAQALLRARKRDRLGEAMALRAIARASAQRGAIERALLYLDRADAVAALRNAPHERLHNARLRAALRPVSSAGPRAVPTPRQAAPTIQDGLAAAG